MKRVRKANSTNTVDFLDSAENTVRGKYAIKILALANYIADFKSGNNYKQNEIAEHLEMAESQISKWLSGFHNLTIKSIIKLESASGIQILNPAIWESNISIKSEETTYSVSSEAGLSGFIETLPDETKATETSGGSTRTTAESYITVRNTPGNTQNAMAA